MFDVLSQKGEIMNAIYSYKNTGITLIQLQLFECIH